MEQKTLNKILEVALKDYIHISVSRQSRSTRYSGQLQMSDGDKLLFIAYIMKSLNCSAEQAASTLKSSFEKTFQSKVGKKEYLLPIIVSLVLAMIFLPLVPLFLLVYTLATAKTRSLKKIWKAHQTSGTSIPDTLDSMAATCKKSAFALTNKALLAALVLVVAVCAYPYAKPYLPLPAHKNLANLLTSYDITNNLSEAEEKLLGMKDDKLVKTMDLVYNEMVENSRSRYGYAVVTKELLDEGKISAEYAGEQIARVLLHDSPEKNASDEDLAYLPSLLSAVSNDVVDAYIAKVATLSEKENSLNRILNTLGSYYASFASTQELASVGARLGYRAAFLAPVLADDTIADLTARLDALENSDDKLFFLTCSAANHTEINDVLAFLRVAQAAGFTPSQCYPDGALVNWDASIINILEFTENSPETWKVLPMIINEKREKKEAFSVPSSEFSLGNNFSSVVDDAYESNQALGKDAFTVRLDTAVLEKMPAELIPETLEEMTSVLTFSNYYIREGTLRNTTYRGSIMTIENIRKQDDYPTYFAGQTIDLVDPTDGLIQHRFMVNMVETPPLPASPSGSSLSDSSISMYYIAAPDEQWMADAKAETIQAFDDVMWNIDSAIFVNYLSLISQE